MRKLLVTGANGHIGTTLTQTMDAEKSTTWELRLGDLTTIEDSRFVSLDVTDPESCQQACEGIHTVLHLAGTVAPDAPFDHIHAVNVLGTQNIFQAAKAAGVKRMVYASSAQAIEGYELDTQITSSHAVRPKNPYGVSKAYGEALGAYYAYQLDLDVIAVRIGAFEVSTNWSQMSARDLSAWISPRDLCHLLDRCLEADLQQPFLIAHGISNNRFKRLCLAETRARLGYEPQDDSFDQWNINLKAESLPAKPS